MRSSTLVGQDGLGEKRFRILLNEQGAPAAHPTNNRYNGYNAAGLELRQRQRRPVGVVDGQSGRGRRHAAGRRQLVESRAVDARPERPDRRLRRRTRESTRRPVLPWGGSGTWPRRTPTAAAWAASGRSTTTAFTSSGCAILYCVDPLSGKTLWTRKNVGAGQRPVRRRGIAVRRAAGRRRHDRLAGRDRRSAGHAAHRAVRQADGHDRPPGALLGDRKAQQVMQLRDAWAGPDAVVLHVAPGAKAGAGRKKPSACSSPTAISR